MDDEVLDRLCRSFSSDEEPRPPFAERSSYDTGLSADDAKGIGSCERCGLESMSILAPSRRRVNILTLLPGPPERDRAALTT
jgi:hypothetical protein